MKSVQLDIKLNQNQNRAETSPTVCLFIVNLKNWNVSRCWKTHQFYYKWFKNKVHFLFGCFIASDPLNHLRHDSFLCCRKTVITVVILVSCDITAARPIKPSVLMVTWDWWGTPEQTAALLPELVSDRRKRFSSSVLLGSADDQKSSQWAAVSGVVGRCGSGHGAARAGPDDGGGFGLCTGTGPVWAGPEGTGSVRAGTSCQLQPGAPDPQLTDASTWSWQKHTAQFVSTSTRTVTTTTIVTVPGDTHC